MSENARVEPAVTVRPGVLPKSGSGEVQVFRLWATGDPKQQAFAMSVLSAEERERAAGYRVQRARNEFVVGRAALRVLLGAALGVEPGVVELGTDRYGKPVTKGIQFNVTHSRGLICIALCREMPVGVDVEWIDPALEVMELAEPNFTAEETRSLALLPAGRQRAAAFCRIWTQKEAVAKADGRGLGVALRNIELPRTLPGLATIPLGADVESVVTAQALPPGNATYQLWGMETPDGFAGALSVGAADSPMVCRFFLLDLLSSGVS